MGVDVTFLPLDCDRVNLTYSHTLLPLDRRYDVQEEIRKLDPRLLGKEMTSYLANKNDGICYGDFKEDCYGEVLTYLTAGELLLINKKIIEHKNKAIWAYLAELPSDTKVVLYWS